MFSDYLLSEITSLATLIVLCLFQIGHRHVVDASLQEEACSLAQLLVSMNGKNNICATQKMGHGALDPNSIFEMIEVRKFF